MLMEEMKQRYGLKLGHLLQELKRVDGTAYMQNGQRLYSPAQYASPVFKAGGSSGHGSEQSHRDYGISIGTQYPSRRGGDQPAPNYGVYSSVQPLIAGANSKSIDKTISSVGANDMSEPAVNYALSRALGLNQLRGNAVQIERNIEDTQVRQDLTDISEGRSANLGNVGEYISRGTNRRINEMNTVDEL
jgi:hypothetical protein